MIGRQPCVSNANVARRGDAGVHSRLSAARHPLFMLTSTFETHPHGFPRGFPSLRIGRAKKRRRATRAGRRMRTLKSAREKMSAWHQSNMQQ